MKRIILKIAVVVIILVAIGGFFAWKNWHDRYVWPSPLPWVQNPPPVDRSRWPKPPVALKSEEALVEVATPDGIKPARITYFTNSVGMKFVRIEPGTFTMGLTEAQARRLGMHKLLAHRVTITRAFLMAAFETTNKQYELFDSSRAKKRPDYQTGKDGDDHPVEPVKWREAVDFCRWLSEKEGRLYRLPTEAEWEYACKAGSSTRLPWGDASWDCNKANVGGLKKNHETWLEDGFMYTAPVGVYPPNAWGLYDMIGNTWEWCNDWYERYTAAPATDPQGPATGHMRVYKGGNWTTRTRDINSAIRDGDDPADIPDTRGFRIVCEIGE